MNPISLVVGILGDALPCRISTEVPEQRKSTEPVPQRMVIVTLEGDRSDPFVLRPVVGLVCFGTSDADAFGLSVDAVTALREAAMTHPYLSSVQLDGKARDPWGRTGEGRYYCLLNLTINTDE